MALKIRLDSDKCVGHGRCYELAPEVFLDDERGHCRIERDTVPPGQEAAARRAEANCPECAIEIVPE